MQFRVPQFLEIEDKIFGPFTFREFVYMAGGAGLCFVLYKLLGIWIGAIPILIVAGFSLLLTFYRPNNKPFVFMLESGIRYLAQSKLYIWKKKLVKKEPLKEKEDDTKTQMVFTNKTKLSGEKLKDLAWSLNVLDLSKKK